MLKLLCFLSLFSLPFVQGYKYKLRTSNDKIFSECPGFPGSLHSMVDLTEFSIKKVGDSVVCGGNVTFIWDGIEETDVMAVRAITEQHRYGKWGPTTFNVYIPNICKDLYKENTPWFDVALKHIKKEDRLCLNKKALVWHMDYYTMDGCDIIIPGYDQSGIYRVLIHHLPHDKNGKLKKDAIYCFAIEYEAIRIG